MKKIFTVFVKFIIRNLMNKEELINGRQRLQWARKNRPYTLSLGFMMPYSGILALIYGDRVSSALSNISSGVPSRVIGGSLLVGGIAVIIGVFWGRYFIEATGIALLAFAFALYGIGVMIGLGLSGMIAGPLSISVATGSVLRVISLTSAAHELSLRKNKSPCSLPH